LLSLFPGCERAGLPMRTRRWMHLCTGACARGSHAPTRAQSCSGVVLRFDGTTARHHSGHHSSPYLVALMAPRVWLFMFSHFTCFVLYPQRLTYSHVYLYLLAQHTCALNHGSSDSRQRIAQKPRHSRRRGAEKVVVGEDYPRYLLRQ
jgi:hypothetical protein